VLEADTLENSWSQLYMIAEQLKDMSAKISETYSDLLANPQTIDTPMGIISKKVFDESEKNGEHRALVTKFQSQAQQMLEFAQTAEHTKNNTIRFMLYLVDARETQEALQESARKHLDMIDKGVRELAAW
jgi:hypothetical protein